MLKYLLTAILAISPAFAANIVLNENNSVTFNQPVSEAYVAKKQFEIMQKHQFLSLSQPIYLVLDTPGGSVSAGNNFIDFVKSLNRPVHTVVIFAASMGYQITQELGKRYITGTGILMSHRGAASGMSGQIPGELNSRVQMLLDILTGMNERAAKRVGMSVEAYQNAIINELWISGHNAVAKNHADEVANITCDKSLLGTYKEEVATLFGSVSVEFSKCPLISVPVGFELSGKKIANNSRGALEVKKLLKKTYMRF